MIQLIASCFLVFLGSYYKAKMDVIMFSGKNLGWKNKWSTTLDGKLKLYKKKHWYYFGHYPLFEEKFLYSSTFLVCFTDDWHKYQFVFLRCIYLAISIQIFGIFLSVIWAFLIFPLIYGIGFTFIFDKLQKKRIKEKYETATSDNTSSSKRR